MVSDSPFEVRAGTAHVRFWLKADHLDQAEERPLLSAKQTLVACGSTDDHRALEPPLMLYSIPVMCRASSEAR
jgi:hypothetical protein